MTLIDSWVILFSQLVNTVSASRHLSASAKKRRESTDVSHIRKTNFNVFIDKNKSTCFLLQIRSIYSRKLEEPLKIASKWLNQWMEDKQRQRAKLVSLKTFVF